MQNYKYSGHYFTPESGIKVVYHVPELTILTRKTNATTILN